MEHSLIRKACVLTSAFLLTVSGSALSYEWEKTFGESGSSEYGRSVQQTTDGGYIIAGYGTAYAYGWNAYLLKTDGSGKHIWNKNIGVSYWREAHSVQQTADGGYIVGGFAAISGTLDFYLVKTDPNGNETWSNTFGGGYDDRGYSVQQTADGGYVIVGEIGTSWPGRTGYDVHLVKTDADGNEAWSNTFGGSGDDSGRFVQQTTDGGYIIVGSTASLGADGYDVYLVKTDADGNEAWSNTFGGSGDDSGRFVQQTTDDGYIIAGSTQSFGAGGRDVYLVKTDADGNEVWSKTFGGSASDLGRCVQQTAGGGYVITGSTGSEGAGGDDVYVIKTDANGNETWSKTFGGAGDDSGYSVRQTSEGGYIIAGDTGHVLFGPTDMYLIYYDPRPQPEIKANGSDGPITVSPDTAVSITVSLDPGLQSGRHAEWWVVAWTPMGWYSYVHPDGWVPGIHLCVQTPLFEISPPMEILNSTLPPGCYKVFFDIDDNLDGKWRVTWRDSVEVRVQ